MELLALPFFVIGLIIFFIGGLMYLIASFQVSVWWGLAVLLLPFAEVIFLFAHWHDAKSPFKIIIFGLLLMWGGGMLGPV